MWVDWLLGARLRSGNPPFRGKVERRRVLACICAHDTAPKPAPTAKAVGLARGVTSRPCKAMHMQSPSLQGVDAFRHSPSRLGPARELGGAGPSASASGGWASRRPARRKPCLQGWGGGGGGQATRRPLAHGLARRAMHRAPAAGGGIHLGHRARVPRRRTGRRRSRRRRRHAKPWHAKPRLAKPCEAMACHAAMATRRRRWPT